MALFGKKSPADKPEVKAEEAKPDTGAIEKRLAELEAFARKAAEALARAGHPLAVLVLVAALAAGCTVGQLESADRAVTKAAQTAEAGAALVNSPAAAAVPAAVAAVNPAAGVAVEGGRQVTGELLAGLAAALWGIERLLSWRIKLKGGK